MKEMYCNEFKICNCGDKRNRVSNFKYMGPMIDQNTKSNCNIKYTNNISRKKYKNLKL